MLDEFAPPKFFASVRGMDQDQLFTEFNIGAARQISLSAEVRMRAEYNIREKRKLRSVVDEQAELLKVRDGEIENLKAQLLLKEAKAAEAIRFRAEVFEFEATEKSLQGADIQPVIATTDTIVEDVAPLQPRRQRKRKIVVAYASGPSHPLKKLREDYGALGGASAVGKSRSVVQSLFVTVVLNVKARGEPILTLPFLTSSVSATPEREDKGPADSVTELNLQTIGVVQRFVISSDSSHHSGANIAEAEVDFIVKSSAPAIATVTTVTATVDADTTADKAHVEPSLFGVGSSSTGRPDSVLGGFLDVSGSDFLIGGIGTVVEPDFDLQKVYAELLKVRDGEIENLKAQLLLKEAKAAEAIRLRAEVFEFEATEKSLQGEVGVLRDHSATLEKEKTELSVKVTDLLDLVKVHELEISSVGLQEKVDVYQDFIGQLEKFQDEKMEEVNKKFDKLCANFVGMALHLEEKFYSHLLTTISGRRWLLTHGMELAIVKCLNLTEYLFVLGAAISKAIKKDFSVDPVSVRMVNSCLVVLKSKSCCHGYGGYSFSDGLCRFFGGSCLSPDGQLLLGCGRKLADVTAYNPSTEADYVSALQRLQNVNFSLIAELKSIKDASVETIINLLCLDDTLAEMLGLTESQPYANQLMVPIHHSPNQRVIGASALSLSLDVSHSRVRNIRENISSHMSVLRSVFVPLSEPLSVVDLEGTKGIFGSAQDTTTAVSVTFVFVGTIWPISTDDYEVSHADGQEGLFSLVYVVVTACSLFATVFCRLQIFHVPGRVCPLRSPSLYAPLPNASVTSYGPSHLACSLFSSKRSKLIPRASLFLSISTPAVLKFGMPILAGITASDPYVNENGVSPLLDLIMAISLEMLNKGEALADT
nr:hypothetical protein [Tanacetum cinerariifolium]